MNIWQNRLRAIRKSDAIVVLISTSSVSSTYVNQEIGVAIEAGKVIIPLVQPEIGVERLAMLQGLKYIPFDFEKPQEGRDRLLVTLHNLVRQQEAARQMNKERVVFICAGVALLLLAPALPGAPAPSGYRAQAFRRAKARADTQESA